MIRSLMEKLISRLSHDGNRAFFDTESFPWVAQIEAASPAIRAELDALLAHRDNIPNFQDISEDQKVLTEGTQWKTFFLYAYGHTAEENCAQCPETSRQLLRIPGMKTAMFSILAPKKHVPEHRGPYKGVLRYHLGLIIPEPNSSCRIRVGSEVRQWSEGKSLIFDESHLHEVWNDSDSWRVVLFVDFLRPLPFPLSLLNRIMVWRISTTPFITEAIGRIRKAAPIHARAGE
jgi:aspartyl/asparaginyl beta-hydroxylase (cupin superfamily)